MAVLISMLIIAKTHHEQVETLDEETNPIILVKSFNALEPEALKAVNKYNLIGIGTLIPSTFLGGKELSDTSFG
ncbi:unnamed protein product, partial [Ilex paraguariensis]